MVEEGRDGCVKRSSIVNWIHWIRHWCYSWSTSFKTIRQEGKELYRQTRIWGCRNQFIIQTVLTDQAHQSSLQTRDSCSMYHHQLHCNWEWTWGSTFSNGCQSREARSRTDQGRIGEQVEWVQNHFKSTWVKSSQSTIWSWPQDNSLKLCTYWVSRRYQKDIRWDLGAIGHR